MTLDAITREVMAHAFAGIAEEMGLVLVHSAVSPNIRERRDASAALFDARGDMIAQAAHIPVHLGALADAVAAVRAEHPRPGELYILNDPYAGGSHLPDLTLVGVIRIAGGVGGYSVVRAHHSDVGGATPGSMPAGARELYAEGIVVRRCHTRRRSSGYCSPTSVPRRCDAPTSPHSGRRWSAGRRDCGRSPCGTAGRSSRKRRGI
jgi:N-methylhydantoinase B